MIGYRHWGIETSDVQTGSVHFHDSLVILGGVDGVYHCGKLRHVQRIIVVFVKFHIEICRAHTRKRKHVGPRAYPYTHIGTHIGTGTGADTDTDTHTQTRTHQQRLTQTPV